MVRLGSISQNQKTGVRTTLSSTTRQGIIDSVRLMRTCNFYLAANALPRDLGM
jgi:hypothetical protein